MGAEKRPHSQTRNQKPTTEQLLEQRAQRNFFPSEKNENPGSSRDNISTF